MNVTNGWILMSANNFNYEIYHEFYKTKEEAINAMRKDVDGLVKKLKQDGRKYDVLDFSDVKMAIDVEMGDDLYYWNVKKIIDD